ncbi:MAG: hypothetical protein GY946_15130 [bacterium]|nr:hypothetical protein [bacterium]
MSGRLVTFLIVLGFVGGLLLVVDSTGNPKGPEQEADVKDPVAGRPVYSSERPGGADDDPTRKPRDLSGRSVKTPRVRAVNTDDASLVGATAWLIKEDPWLAYARGRELFLREFSAADGVFGESGRFAGGTLDDGATKQMTRDHVSSCVMCHNTPWRDGGAGVTIAKNGGAGRNTPHLFGAGLLEMLAAQTRLKLLAIGDADRNGFVGLEEAQGVRAHIEVGDQTVEYGRFDDKNGDGRPDLDPILYVWYVDEDGERIPWARSLKDGGVAGYNFELQVFGHGQRDFRSHGGISGTLRAFSANAFDVHAGLPAHDPAMNREPERDGLAALSLCGAQQFFTGTTRDRGQRLDAAGRSLDDPDRDGIIEEITAGDLDLIEWYQLNHPRPAERPSPGRQVFDRIGCTTCHVPDWQIEEKREGPDYTQRRTGDRRFFDLAVESTVAGPRGRLIAVKRGAAGNVRGLYSDLRHHDLGPAFHELQYDGTLVRTFRTTPLWGVGSSAPYGHDGASLSLDAVIRRHSGEAAEVTANYAALPAEDRTLVLEFLRGLVLYATDTLPCDVNGDGTVATSFEVAGIDTGPERFNPEWLFRVPARVEGWVVNPRGERIFSHAVTNLREAYGLDLPYLKDRNRNGWPDVLDERAKGLRK